MFVSLLTSTHICLLLLCDQSRYKKEIKFPIPSFIQTVIKWTIISF